MAGSDDASGTAPGLGGLSRWAKMDRVVELVLTDERRRELIALLDDQQRLQREYPRLAEYLEMAPKLPGTGNDQLDAAFDLRFVHYMTGGDSVSLNPYWDIVSPMVFEESGRRVVNGGRPGGSGRLAYAETVLQSTYAYAIPSPETLDWVAEFSADRQVIEVGAGRGYWAALLSRSGIEIDAYDIAPPANADNPSFARAPGQKDSWHPVNAMQSLRCMNGELANSTLFLCWPAGWGSTMASDTLASFERSGGKRLIFIGELQGGKTGDEKFFDSLAAGWNLLSEDASFVSWWNLNDVAQCWVRR